MAAPRAADEACPFEHEQVFRYGVDRHAVRFGQLRHPRRSIGKLIEKSAPCPVGERVEYAVEAVVHSRFAHLFLNQMVDKTESRA